MSITKLLNKKIDRTLFTTPSHSQKAPFSKNLSEFYRLDYSEIEGFDNLQNPKNAILLSQGLASDILHTKQTFYVVQGATTALLAAMKTLISPGDRVLVARNCHKTIFNGLILTAGLVDWFIPDTDPDWGIYTTINPEKLKKTLELNQYKVFIMTSPTYEGINSDIKEISKICRSHGVYLIVDEAHGSLYNFSSLLPESAIAQGADVSVNSLHKTAGALNQTALLNVSSSLNIDITLFQKSLNIFQTTSPSYPLLSNIEACISYLNSKEGKSKIDLLIKEIDKMKQSLSRFGVEFYNDIHHDPTKILVKKDGISGVDLSKTMFDDFNIEDELNNFQSVLYLSGVGTALEKIEKLKNALKKVATNPSFVPQKASFQPHPITKIQPVASFNCEYVYINRADAAGRISNKLICPYPPGIGILYPGEAIQEWHLDYLTSNVEVVL